MGQTLLFTENAARKVWELIEEEGNLDLKLRVYITGGGCSGFQYGFTFDETINDDDTVIEKTLSLRDKQPYLTNAKTEDQDDDEESGSDSGCATVRLLIDPMSLQYLTGAEIDYEKDLKGEQFIIRNPNAKTTCGCGSSFSA